MMEWTPRFSPRDRTRDSSFIGRMKIQSNPPGKTGWYSDRDYSAVGRKAYLVEDLEDGALPLYDKDPIVPAYAVAESGNSIAVLVDSQRVVAQLFEIATLPMIPLTQIRERRYDEIKRTIRKVA
jgi:hypothetical protein